MSWSYYQTHKTVEGAKAAVAALKEPSHKHDFGTPPDAKKLILDAIECCGEIQPGIGLKIEAAGHKPGGCTYIRVEPVSLGD
jgi:hypothetical protein